MDAGHEVGDRNPGLDRWSIGESRHARHAHHRLHRQVHRWAVAIAALLAVSAAAGVHEPRIHLAHHGISDAKPVHHAGREVLQHHIRHRNERQKLFFADRGLEVDADASLVDVQCQERIPGPVGVRPIPQILAAGRLDLDDVRAGLGE